MNVGHTRFGQLGEQVIGDLVVRRSEDLAGLLVDNVFRERTADNIVTRYGDLLDAGVAEIADVACSDPLVFLDQHLAVLAEQVEARDLAAKPLRHQVHMRTLLRQMERIEGEEMLEDVLVGEADRLEQRRHRHLAPAVDPEIQVILGIELEVEP